MTSPAPYQRGDRVALVATSDPDTRLRPGDQGTVTRWDPAQGQFSDCPVPLDVSELLFYVADMPVTLTSRLGGHRGPIAVVCLAFDLRSSGG